MHAYKNDTHTTDRVYYSDLAKEYNIEVYNKVREIDLLFAYV